MRIENERCTPTRSNSATATALPSEIDPLSQTMRSLAVIRIEAPRSRTRPRNDVTRSRGATPEEVADTTPFALIDPDNPASTQRDLPVGVSCRRAWIAIIASLLVALASSVAFAA